MSHSLLLVLTSTSLAQEVPADEAPKGCDVCTAWAEPHPPFRLLGESWYIGGKGLSSAVVRTTDGLVLLDGTLPEMVPLLAGNLQSLGLDVAEVRFILVSHAHFDHVGGVAALQRRSGAVVVTTEAGAQALRSGNVPASDPQAGMGADAMSYPPVVGEIRTLSDGQTLEVGGTTFTLHATPGHTPGGATWSWESCEEDTCGTVVYADSLNAVSADGYRFGDHPSELEAFRASIDKVRSMDCDVLVPVHPSFGRLFEQAVEAETKGSRAFLDDRACRVYAADAARRLKKRLTTERAP
jgi:metallo-beta-lactamase class B